MKLTAHPSQRFSCRSRKMGAVQRVQSRRPGLLSQHQALLD